MEVITTHRNQGQPKPFSWSYSKLKNFENCPRKFHHTDILKDFPEEKSDQLKWGNEIHDAAAKRISKNTPLPDTMASILEPWIQRITSGPPAEFYVEQKYALTEDHKPTEWFANNVWFRSICDVLKVQNNIALAIDWKTGRILEDGVQLALVAACVFAHFPSVVYVRSEFIWLKDDASSRVDFTRAQLSEIWQNVIPRVTQLEDATRQSSYPPRPGRLCRNHCPVASCEYMGK